MSSSTVRRLVDFARRSRPPDRARRRTEHGRTEFNDSNQTVRSTVMGLFDEWHARILWLLFRYHEEIRLLCNLTFRPDAHRQRRKLPGALGNSRPCRVQGFGESVGLIPALFAEYSQFTNLKNGDPYGTRSRIRLSAIFRNFPLYSHIQHVTEM